MTGVRDTKGGGGKEGRAQPSLPLSLPPPPSAKCPSALPSGCAGGRPGGRPVGPICRLRVPHFLRTGRPSPTSLRLFLFCRAKCPMNCERHAISEHDSFIFPHSTQYFPFPLRCCPARSLHARRGPEEGRRALQLKADGRAGSRERKNEVYEACASERGWEKAQTLPGLYVKRERKGGLGEVGSKDFAPTERPSDVSAFCAWLSQKKEGIG